MLSKSNRLGRRDIGALLRGGKRLNLSPISIRYYPSEEKLMASVVVPNSVSKSAVVRNRLKRQARHALREFVNRNIVLMVTLQRGAQGLSYKDIKKTISDLIDMIDKNKYA